MVGDSEKRRIKFDRWLDSVLMQKTAIRKPKLTKLIRSTLIETVMDDYKTEYDPEWVLATLNDAKEALENLIAYVEDSPDAVKETLDDGIQDVYAKLNYAYNSAKDGPEALMTMDDDDLVAFPNMRPSSTASTSPENNKTLGSSRLH